MIKLIRRLCRPRIRLTRPNKTPKSKSSLIRLEKKGSQRVAKDNMRGRTAALPPQLKLIPRPKRAKKNDARIPRSIPPRSTIQIVISKAIISLIVLNLSKYKTSCNLGNLYINNY